MSNLSVAQNLKIRHTRQKSQASVSDFKKFKTLYNSAERVPENAQNNIEPVSSSQMTAAKSTKKQQLITLSNLWRDALPNYELMKLIGVGSYGEVVQAKHKASGQIVAIKLIKNILRTEYETKKIVREIQILRHFTQMKNNHFTTKILDIISPNNQNLQINHIFIVLEYMPTDLKRIFQSIPQLKFKDDNLLSILYNLLCTLNFIHTANIIHRDIKPANLLVNVDCKVKICDFGLARSNPYPEQYYAPRLSRQKQTELLNSQRKQREAQPRELSNHVVSRWYRSPEIILVEKNYNQSIDLWSTGCILSEMICSTENYKNLQESSTDRFLFPGSSCFPLSPCEKMKNSNSDKNIVSKQDQLKVILEIMGDQNEEDTSFVTDVSAISYIHTLESKLNKIEFQKEFMHTSSDILAILEDLLQFNPHFRSKPSELLKNKVFNRIRNPALEKPAPFQIFLDIDRPGSFNYDKCKSIKYSQQDFLQMIDDEIQIIQKMKLI